MKIFIYKNIKTFTLSLEMLSILYYDLRVRNNIKIISIREITHESSILNVIGDEINRLGFQGIIKKF